MRVRIERDRILYPPERSLRPRARAAARKLSRADFSAALRCGKNDHRRFRILHSPSFAYAPCSFSVNTSNRPYAKLCRQEKEFDR